VGNFDGDVLQILDTGAADADELLFRQCRGDFVGCQGEAQTGRSERTA
jgi:hypothetical protein